MATSIKIDSQLKSRIQHLAEIQHRSTHWLILEAIKEYVEREEALESFKREALVSWKTYQETGKHLTGQETREWLKGWGENPQTEPPKCHE